MTQPQLDQAILATIAEELAYLSPPPIAPDTALADCRADDVDRMALAIALEDRFHVAIPDAEIQHWQTMADLIRSVTTRTGAEVAA